LERLRDGLEQTDVLEAIMSAQAITKVIRSTSVFRQVAAKSSTSSKGLPSPPAHLH